MSEFVLQGTSSRPTRRIDFTRELNQEQLVAVTGGDGPCLVLAGAGSGKTRTVTYRVAYLLEQGVDPSSILLLTFTNKASREMLDRVSALAGAEAKGVWGGTFHSIANRLLRMNVAHAGLGYTPSFTILDEEDSRSLVKAVMKELKIDPRARRFPSASVVQNILSFSRNVMVSVEEALEMKHPNFAPFSGELEEIGRIYTTRKRNANSMDFDDLLVNFLGLVSHPDIGPMLASRFQYILVDEYQDTNALQASIVSGLGQAHRNVLVVGDDAQSIYAFRGADVKNILRFPTSWPDARIFKLLTNYRSVPEILDLANESLSHNVGQFEKDLVGVKPRGKKPLLVPASSARQEAAYVAEQVLALRAEGVALGNIAVLFRSSAHSQSLEMELVKRDVPYEYRGGMKFFGRAHIKDVLAHLRIGGNPQDEAAWLRVLNLQDGIGAVTAASLARQVIVATDLSSILGADVVQALPARARGGWSALTTTLRDAVANRKDPASMVRSVVTSSYQDHLEREYPDFRDRLEDLEQLALFAEGYPDLSAFLADISLYDDVLAGRERGAGYDEERMVLSTIHQAKGLEWDTVFVIHLADNAFPSRYAMDAEEQIEEERRLFYVAATRARNRLVLTYPMTMGSETLVFNRPSMFLEELPPRLLERVELREARSIALPRGGGFSFDGGFHDEETIVIDRSGERTTSSKPGSATVWKKKT
ncbi:ATP-dependent helicase [Patescibacteria group bacterium]|nr:ATP-dependent helicase [Patescibacteria group bacterium]MBU1448642.1 ATP-dependent helicase [Patescibacteria group bacterium]MBU2613506.1 ATP-dependent helicase [Patescibacteria group bacterium]